MYSYLLLAVTQVLLFSQDARVVEHHDVAVLAGRHEVVIDSLPAGIIDHTIAAHLEGATVGGIEVVEYYGPSATPQVLRTQSAAVESLEQQLRAVRDELATARAKRAFLARIHTTRQRETAPKDSAAVGNRLHLQPGLWEQTLEFVTEGLRETYARETELVASQAKLNEEIAGLRIALRDARARETEVFKRVRVFVEARTDTTATLQLQYHIRGASWRPAYDVRISSDGDVVDMTLYAVARQETGQDWSGAELSFSTANPQSNVKAPELRSWRITDQRVARVDDLEEDAVPDSGDAQVWGEGPSARVYVGKKVNLELTHTDIHIVLRRLADVSRMNIVTSDRVKGRVTMRLQEVPWDLALDLILESQGLGMERFGNVLRIDTLENLQLDRSERNKALEASRDSAPIETMLLPLKWADAQEMTELVRKRLSANGNVMFDRRTNTLIIDDHYGVLERIKGFVKTMDAGPAPRFNAWSAYERPVTHSEAGRESADSRTAHKRARGSRPQRLSRHLWQFPAGAEYTFTSTSGPLIQVDHVLHCPSPAFSAGGFDYSYDLEGLATLVADGREKRFAVASFEVPAEGFHRVVPLLTEQAFRYVRLDNTSKRPLLAGEVHLFVDDEYTSRGFLETVGAGAKAELPLGVDEAVQAKRFVERETRDHGVIGGRTTTNYDVHITVTSHRNSAIEVLVQDRIPITWEAREEVAIRHLPSTPAVKEMENNGTQIWKLTLSPNSSGHVRFGYSIAHKRVIRLSEEVGL